MSPNLGPEIGRSGAAPGGRASGFILTRGGSANSLEWGPLAGFDDMEEDETPLASLTARLNRLLWETDARNLTALRRFALSGARLGYAVCRDLVDGQLSLRAMSLVYTTLLSLVPLLAISFSVLKGLGVQNQLEPALLGFLAPFGEKGAEVGQRIIEFVNNINVKALGSVGLALLLYTIVSLMHKIEWAFNFVWRVGSQRTFSRRFSDYLSVVMIGPLLVFSSLGLTTALVTTKFFEQLSALPVLGFLITIAATLVPYLLVIAAFTFIYVFMPNTRVNISAAAVGAAVAGLLWHLAVLGFTAFIAESPNYAAIYSAFAALVVFMIWLYVGWLILLTGASIAFYFQNPDYQKAGRTLLRLSSMAREKLILSAAKLIGARYYDGGEGISASHLAKDTGAALEAIEWALGALEGQGLIARTGEGISRFLPARPPDTTPLSEVLAVVQSTDDVGPMASTRLYGNASVDSLIDRLKTARITGVEGVTWRDFILDAGKLAATV
jgi:membrane protein